MPTKLAVVLIVIFAEPSNEAEPVKSPARLIVLASSSAEAVLALPRSVAVMFLAEKSPDASRATIAFAVFKFVAVVAEFAILPDVVIVAK